MPAERDGELPRWFVYAATVPGIAVALVGVVGLVLALLGIFTTWLTLALATPAVIAATVVSGRGARPRPSSRSAAAWATAAVVLALGYAVFAASVPSQNVRLSRDPGAYLNTGRWLAREGTLEVDAAGTAFDGIDELTFDSAAVHRSSPGTLEFQFNHLTAVILAVGFDLGGHGLMLRMPALASAAGLLAVYAVAVGATKRPGPALLAPALLAVSLPVLFVSRNTYSEPFALLLLWAATAMLCTIHASPRRGTAVVGGAVLGAMVCTRIDAALFASVFALLIGVSVSTRSNPTLRSFRLRCWLLAFGTFSLFCAVAALDVLVRAGHYAENLRSQIVLLGVLAVGSCFGAVALFATTTRWPDLLDRLKPVQRRIAPLAALVVSALFLAGWLIRPLVQQVRTGQSMQAVDTQRAAALVAGLQRKTGIAVDPTRLYYEESLRWMSWYLGAPGLIAAIAGAGLTTWRTLRSLATPEAVTTLAIAVVAGGLYLWNPSIYPDQLWASRRFVPAVLPALALLAAIALSAVAAPVGGPRSTRAAVSLLVVGSSVAIVGAAATTTWPLRWQRTQSGYLDPVLEVCSALGERSAVLVLGTDAATVYPQTFRSWCGTTVAVPERPLDAAQLAAIAAGVDAHGYRLHLVTTQRTLLTPFISPTGPLPIVTSAVSNRWQPESTLDRPPAAYVPEGPEPNPRFHILAVANP